MSNIQSEIKTRRASTANKPLGKNLILWGCLGVIILPIAILVIASMVYLKSNSAKQSVVIIKSPTLDSSYQLGETIPIQAIARDDDNVSEVEIWINNQLIAFEETDIQNGINPFPVYTSWQPVQPGTYTVSARSTDTRGKRSVDQINITILDHTDTDRDFVPDHMDECPQQSGMESAMGCMDQDFDGIPDDQDACPLEAGYPLDGCPSPSEVDSDGDGYLNTADACPDEIGSPGANGCPDTDGDGLTNMEDACPQEAGMVSGCPAADDQDGDGISDSEDICPYIWGLPVYQGCADDDNDGVPDQEDACPGQAGSSSNNGCPDMGSSPPTAPSPADDDDPPEINNAFNGILMYFLSGSILQPEYPTKAPVDVEIELYNLFTPGEYYERLNCYVRIDEGEPYIYELYTTGTYNWPIESRPSITFEYNDENIMDISVECGGIIGDTFTRVVDLDVTHPSYEWDGRDLSIREEGFMVNYRICTPSCDESELIAPVLNRFYFGDDWEGPYEISWEWDGNEEDIDGFRFINIQPGEGTYWFGPSVGPEARSVVLDDYQPVCGGGYNLAVLAYKNEGGHLIYSRRSNHNGWHREDCDRIAMITFQYIDLHSPAEDEGGERIVGPIEGVFYASSGSEFVELPFDAVWSSVWGHRHDGMKLPQGRYTFQSFIDWIHREQASCLGNGCHSNSYSAPETDFVYLEVLQEYDITIGGVVYDDDTGSNASDYVFANQTTVEIEHYDSPTPQWVTIEGEQANLEVIIQILPQD